MVVWRCPIKGSVLGASTGAGTTLQPASVTLIYASSALSDHRRWCHQDAGFGGTGGEWIAITILASPACRTDACRNPVSRYEAGRHRRGYTRSRDGVGWVSLG